MAVDLSAPRLSSLEPEQERMLMDLSLVLAHRLRGLVASIEGFTDMLADTLASREQREMALRILEGTTRIERILADLQLYSQHLEPVMMPMRLAALMDGLLAMLPEEEQERVTVSVDAPPSCSIVGDPQLLRQSLLILVQNALEAAGPEGPVRLSVELDAASSQVRFEVWNEGVIALEDAETLVFVPFFTTKAQNLGVGLSIARRIVEAQEGSLTLVHNDAEQGICFRLELPATVL